MVLRALAGAGLAGGVAARISPLPAAIVRLVMAAAAAGAGLGGAAGVAACVLALVAGGSSLTPARLNKYWVALSSPSSTIQIALKGSVMPSHTPTAKPLTKPIRKAGLAPLMTLAILSETCSLTLSLAARRVPRKAITPGLRSGHSTPKVGTSGMALRAAMAMSRRKLRIGIFTQAGSARHAQPAKITGISTGLAMARIRLLMTSL